MVTPTRGGTFPSPDGRDPIQWGLFFVLVPGLPSSPASLRGGVRGQVAGEGGEHVLCEKSNLELQH